MSNPVLQAVRGMNDILPDEAGLWLWFEDVVRAWLESYGYRNIRMPLLEPTALFKRAIGEVTDIVEKEMYSFEDSLNGDHLTLRPEGTASCVRAVLQHNLLYNAPPALVLHGGDVPPRAPAEGALPPVSPGRRGGAGLRRTGHRFRDDPDVRTLVAQIGHPRRDAAAQHIGRHGGAASAPRS